MDRLRKRMNLQRMSAESISNYRKLKAKMDQQKKLT